MRGKSHLRIAQYLIEHYLPDAPKRYQRAFQIGCIEPDRNPATYLKGSLKFQWLRGHNYRNARGYMCRLSRRLESRSRLRLLDYYTIGKLIHYTTDAFTYAHNAEFPAQLKNHREYEVALQEYFLDYMAQDPQVNPTVARSIMTAISGYHHDYEQIVPNITNDCHFALTACCCVLAILFVKPIL